LLAADRNNQSRPEFNQSRIDDNTCENPLDDVPAKLIESEDVLIAHVQFLWSRDNSEWTKLAKSASTKYPDSRMLKLFFAEAVLDGLVRTDRDAIAGGILHNITTAEFDGAVETLYLEAREAIDKGYALVPSIAHNAALAIRFTSDHSRAKEILDVSIEQYPDDEKLRLQRAVIALEENDRVGALKVLPDKPTDPEVIGILAEVLAASGKQDKALALIDGSDQAKMPKHVKAGFLAVRVRTYIARGEKQLAIDEIKRRVTAEPNDLTLRLLLIHTFSLLGDNANAEIAFKSAFINQDQTELSSRLALSFEAQQLGHYDAIIGLLKDRVATDRESEGLHTLIAASINSGHWVLASSILSAISPNFHEREWFLKTDAILAINTGDQTADEKIAKYLAHYPNDARIILARIGLWQRSGRDSDIRNLLQRLILADLVGQPGERIHVAALMTHYGEALRGLEYAYSVLMNNWNIPKAHLAFHGLILLNENIASVMPSANVVAENTVVCLRADDGERRYRIEKELYASFGDERITPNSDLAIALLGKQPGDKINLQDRIASKLVEVSWIKSVYIDAFHCSLEQFNERFPRANGLQKFKFDTSAPDPLEDVRAITKARAEADQRILAEYKSKNIPLSFAATFIGKDPRCLGALPSVDIQFQVCRGTHPEREEALQTILKRPKRVCRMNYTIGSSPPGVEKGSH
jgi:tetratricopeptide (TPR) repeat protein